MYSALRIDSFNFEGDDKQAQSVGADNGTCRMCWREAQQDEGDDKQAQPDQQEQA